MTVTDPARQYVADLNRDDFTVIENGVPQTLTFFARTGVPLALTLLIDSSASMEKNMATAQEAAIGFARQIGPGTWPASSISTAGSRSPKASPTTSPRWKPRFAGRSAGGSTTLYNAVYIALKELAKLTPQDDPQAPRRRAIVVLSDGDDTSSLVSFEEVQDLAARSDTVIYTIGLGPRADGASAPPMRARSSCGASRSRRVAGPFSAADQGPGRRLSRHP